MKLCEVVDIYPNLEMCAQDPSAQFIIFCSPSILAEKRTISSPFQSCVLDTFFCLGGFGSYRRLWTYNAVHFSEVH